VKPGVGNQIVVTAILHSDQVEVDQGQSGNRVEIVSHLHPGTNADSGRVDYEITVPADASIVLRSSNGILRAEKLQGDLYMEGAMATVEVRDTNNGRVRISTMNGTVTLKNVRDEHVDITSISGDINLAGVEGPVVKVNSTSGRIHYDGEFSSGGEYYLSSHSGDIEATAPAYASIDVTARSIKGLVENDFPLQPKHTPFAIKAGSAFAGTVGKAASSVKLLSFSGKIHLKQRP
jgi:DUF4097 and DUF4098 domain-containing protein YvlB